MKSTNQIVLKKRKENKTQEEIKSRNQMDQKESRENRT